MKALIVICMVLVFNQSLFSQQTEIETKLKGFQAKSIQGEKVVDYDLMKLVKNKVVILEFWETWCGPCIEGMPHLKDLKNKFPTDLQIICVSSDDFKKTVDFIKENKYPFDYVYDAKEQLSSVFPHTGIPHTVVIDKKGKIQAETLPGYISESDIDRLISGTSIDLPFKKAFNPGDLNKVVNKPSLVSFELQNYELGGLNYSTETSTKGNKRIIFGYTTKAFKDTVETIHSINLSGKNILQLYQLAYKGLSELRFIFPNELNYINSFSPNNRYRLNYSVSNLFGDFNAVLVRQLDATFGLETETIEKDTTVLVLKKIEPNGSSIILTANRNCSGESKMLIQSFAVTAFGSSLSDIAGLLESKTHLPVEFSKTDTRIYKLNISIKSDMTASLEDWLLLFEKEGIFLVKEKKKVEYIRIKKTVE